MRHYRRFRYWKSRRCKAGENNPFAKIGKSVVDYIRSNYSQRVVTSKMLADKFGISEGHVRRILRGDNWKGGFGNVGKKKLSSEQESQIIQRFYSTYSLKQHDPQKWSERKLAKEFNVSKGLVHYILIGKKQKGGLKNG